MRYVETVIHKRSDLNSMIEIYIFALIIEQIFRLHTPNAAEAAEKNDNLHKNFDLL